MAIIGLNKKSHILEDRLLALELLVRRIKEQAIGFQYTRNVFYGRFYLKFISRETNNAVGISEVPVTFSRILDC